MKFSAVNEQFTSNLATVSGLSSSHPNQQRQKKITNYTFPQNRHDLDKESPFSESIWGFALLPRFSKQTTPWQKHNEHLTERFSTVSPTFKNKTMYVARIT